ncbi:hypothetical protein JCM21900_001879 [Sporobolomyces salmonicolor]
MGIIAYFHVHWSLKREKRWWRATYGGEPGEPASEMSEHERLNLQEKGRSAVPEIRLGDDAEKRAQEEREASGSSAEGINTSPV